MESHFAPLDRATPEDLEHDIETVRRNRVVELTLDAFRSLLVILNEQRQIVALNDAFLKRLGFESPATLLGLRVGEAFNCTHARNEPEGCGSTQYCSTCGAAIAMVATLTEGASEERLCVMECTENGKVSDQVFRVWSHPTVVEGRRLILMFMQDETDEHRRATMERAFLHDINNVLVGLLGSAEILSLEAPESELVGNVNAHSQRLAKEVRLQQWLVHASEGGMESHRETVTMDAVVADLRAAFSTTQALRGRALEFPGDVPEVTLSTDPTLLQRVLGNMVINALEETPTGGAARVDVEHVDGCAIFRVWNAGVIPADVQLRVFQRNFSTKKGKGRGLGAWIVKVLGEEILGGRVGFTSTEADGTEFHLELPI